MTSLERARAESLLRDYLSRAEYRDLRHNTRTFFGLVGAAARTARHGPPPTRSQRLGYRTAKRNRARAAARLLYGDPAVANPRGPADPAGNR